MNTDKTAVTASGIAPKGIPFQAANKKHNSYALSFGKLYETTPKAVFAAIAFSKCSNGGEETTQEAISEFVNEWWVLFRNGIVPQKPNL